MFITDLLSYRRPVLIKISQMDRLFIFVYFYWILISIHETARRGWEEGMMKVPEW